MEIDTEYTVKRSVGESADQIIFTFTPELTGSYTFSSLDQVSGQPRVCVFDSNNDLVEYYESEGGREFFTNYF